MAATITEEDMKTCCLKSCNGKVSKSDGWVDVRAFAMGKADKTDFKVNWDKNGVATFHMKCWKPLSDACRNDSKGDLRLKDLEKDMLKEAKKHAEFHNSYESLLHEATRIAKMLKTCTFPIAFTGAGISTAAGIGDFRGIHGKWTSRDKNKKFGEQGTVLPSKKKKEAMKGERRPTYSHEAIHKLIEMGYIKHLISQNTDGLHRLSGIPLGNMSELHGNTFVDVCENCNKRYDRHPSDKKQSVPPKKCKHCRINHRTGKICPDQKCKGYLMNTIINFGDYLESDILEKAEANAEKADMVLALGTTLQVSPANSLVEMGEQPTRLILCNRQVTPYDDVCYETNKKGEQVGSRVFGDCDDLMREVMLQIMSKEEHDTWVKGRSERMKHYDAQRK